MAECKVCGEKLSFFGNCKSCEDKAELDAEQRRADKEKTELKANQDEERRKAERDAIIVTTEVASNLQVAERKGIIVAHQDSSFDVKLEGNKEALLTDLREQAYAIDADAVVAITFTVTESYSASIGAGNFKLFKLVAYGTAVKLAQT